jgi:AcrR family transcriptional regulator
MAAPIPLDAPVTTATFPASFCDMTLVLSVRPCCVLNGTYYEYAVALARFIVYHLVQNNKISFFDRLLIMTLGRPRSFDVNKALDCALNIFWRKGFEGTSLPDLTKAMGINRPSLYAAFGNKESLFRRAVERYEEKMARPVQEALSEPDVHAAVESLLRNNVDVVTDPKNPRGCLMVQGALACGDEADALRCELAERRGNFETMLRKRFEQAIEEGNLPAGLRAADLARYVATLSHGIAVQAAGGASRAQLMRVVTLAMRAWPLSMKQRSPSS